MVHDFQTITLGIRFFSFHITYSFSFFEGNMFENFHMFLIRKTKYSLTFCNNFYANEPMYKKAIEVYMNPKRGCKGMTS